MYRSIHRTSFCFFCIQTIWQYIYFIPNFSSCKMLTYYGRDPHILHLFHLQFQKVDASASCSSRASSFQAVLKTLTRLPARTEVFQGLLMPTFPRLRLLSSFTCFQLKTVQSSDRVPRGQVLPCFGNMIGFGFQTVTRYFKQIARPSRICSVAQLIAPWLWFDYKLGQLKVFGSSANGYALLEQRTCLDSRIRPMYDGSSMDSAAPCRCIEEDEATSCLSYLISSHWQSLIISARLYEAILDGCEALRMHSVEERGCLVGV